MLVLTKSNIIRLVAELLRIQDARAELHNLQNLVTVRKPYVCTSSPIYLVK